LSTHCHHYAQCFAAFLPDLQMTHGQPWVWKPCPYLWQGCLCFWWPMTLLAEQRNHDAPCWPWVIILCLKALHKCQSTLYQTPCAKGLNIMQAYKRKNAEVHMLQQMLFTRGTAAQHCEWTASQNQIYTGPKGLYIPGYRWNICWLQFNI
jgi:hypothetical protein